MEHIMSMRFRSSDFIDSRIEANGKINRQADRYTHTHA